MKPLQCLKISQPLSKFSSFLSLIILLNCRIKYFRKNIAPEREQDNSPLDNCSPDNYPLLIAPGTIPPWTIAPYVNCPLCQNATRTITPRTIASYANCPPDNYPPDNCPMDNCPADNFFLDKYLPPTELSDTLKLSSKQTKL